MEDRCQQRHAANWQRGTEVRPGPVFVYEVRGVDKRSTRVSTPGQGRHVPQLNFHQEAVPTTQASSQQPAASRAGSSSRPQHRHSVSSDLVQELSFLLRRPGYQPPSCHLLTFLPRVSLSEPCKSTMSLLLGFSTFLEHITHIMEKVARLGARSGTSLHYSMYSTNLRTQVKTAPLANS